MKVTLAIVLAVFVSAGFGAGRRQSPQQQASPAEPSQPNGAEPTQQQTTPPPASQPCAQSKDTCELTEPAVQQPASPPAAKDQEQPPSPPKPKATTGRKRRVRRHQVAKKQTVAQDGSGPKKTVVREGGTSDPAVALTPGATPQTRYSREMIEDLLSTTDTNLKQAASRPLNTNQEETVNQIKLFMEQANQAVKAGDLDRGHNLALKAHLLSDDLVKH